MPEFTVESPPSVIDGPITGDGEVGPPPAPVRVAPKIDPHHPITRPPYPAQAIRQELEGLVVVNACVRPDGRIAELGLKKSSGYRILDDAVLKHLAKPGTRMLPGTEDGSPVTACTDVPIRFQFDGR